MLHNFQRCLEQNSGYETDNVKVLYYDLEKGYQGIYRSYEYHRVCTILDGSKHVSINKGKEFIYSPNEFLLLPPHSSVEMSIEEDTKALVYEISDQVISSMIDKVQYNVNQDITLEDRNHIHTHDFSSIASPIYQINTTLQEQDHDKHILIDLLTQELVYHMIKRNYIHNVYTSDQTNPIKYAIHYLHQHIKDNISITELAYQMNLSPSHFSSLFKNATGISPKAYLSMLKLKKAKQLLETKTVTEVAYELGYENISYFIHLFKKEYGTTPKKYKMSASHTRTIVK